MRCNWSTVAGTARPVSRKLPTSKVKVNFSHDTSGKLSCYQTETQTHTCIFTIPSIVIVCTDPQHKYSCMCVWVCLCVCKASAEFRCLAFALLHLFLAKTHTQTTRQRPRNWLQILHLWNFIHTTTTTTTNLKAQAKLLWIYFFSVYKMLRLHLNGRRAAPLRNKITRFTHKHSTHTNVYTHYGAMCNEKLGCVGGSTVFNY